ncbi:DNA adenine methylase [Brevibacterium iodinum ATCC 49514]|uniref:site-specific DNA-methyltransferase (adenine-specific) n=1 Tax=Brevibacterium iodinum ATCC 49514 TaxID=1255616 RepID=A0A2H1KKZ3_9MICO|nr:DNA adenine methylase [Brevibacterium iodinum]SMY00455.1 DNA adenine methylase [Brevibacterium iodinum ATCC 49514]SUW70193.1 Site-specific DNA methylase [Brevibacterium iodinum]
MPITPSPLRYPGGKTALFKLAEPLLEWNGLRKTTYAEPFAGGGGLALSLLFEGVVRRIVLNDIDPGIYSLWHTILNDTDELIRRIRDTPITMDEWYRQREIYRSTNGEVSLDLAFATLFLNRTNRSGVIKGGVIGGKAQAGDYKLDCRFSKKNTIEKIERITRYKRCISITREDGQKFLKGMSICEDRIVYFIDPPYYGKGSGLYTNFYQPEDHAALAATVRELEQPWILTYDLAPQIQQLYLGLPQYAFDLNYTAAIKRVGTELMVTSPDISVAGISQLRRPVAA